MKLTELGDDWIAMLRADWMRAIDNLNLALNITDPAIVRDAIEDALHTLDTGGFPCVGVPDVGDNITRIDIVEDDSHA